METILKRYGVTLSNGCFTSADGTRLTDPYKDICYSVGDGNDFVCFDFAIVSPISNKHWGSWLVVLDSTVNSESAHFIESFGHEIVEIEGFTDGEARRVAAIAAGMGDGAADWCGDTGKPIRFKRADAHHFARAVAWDIARRSEGWADRNIRITPRMIREGSKTTLALWGV